jgi:hypothetical protein
MQNVSKEASNKTVITLILNNSHQADLKQEDCECMIPGGMSSVTQKNIGIVKCSEIKYLNLFVTARPSHN